ncbi:MAG: hypothetical protein RLZZ65_1463 [Bacteroidota bacterium]|jgi:hypothetical protein
MNRKFKIQHIWFNNEDANVTLSGQILEDVLYFDTKLVIKMSRLNSVINLWQKETGLEASEYLCRYEFGFLTEYQMSFPEEAQVWLDFEELIGDQKDFLKKIVA